MKKRILLADDDPAIRQLLGRVLRLENFEVIFAQTGREAVAKYLDGAPDLVLLDLNMPDKDGWEAWHLMSSLHPTLPVIIITARPHQCEKASRMRANALMEKPLDLPVLLEAIHRLVAEPEPARLARLADPAFQTTQLQRPQPFNSESLL